MTVVVIIQLYGAFCGCCLCWLFNSILLYLHVRRSKDTINDAQSNVMPQKSEVPWHCQHKLQVIHFSKRHMLQDCCIGLHYSDRFFYLCVTQCKWQHKQQILLVMVIIYHHHHLNYTNLSKKMWFIDVGMLWSTFYFLPSPIVVPIPKFLSHSIIFFL